MDLSKLQKSRTLIGEITEKQDGKSVTVAGWVYESRDLGKIRFIILRDLTGDLQVFGAKGKASDEILEKMNKVNRESVVAISGKIQKSAKAPGGRELVPEDFVVINTAEEMLPIDTSDFSKTEMPKRLDYRFLDFHRKRTQAIFKIQSTITQVFREHFYNKGFVDMQPPCLIGTASEGGTDVFEVKYFDTKAYLAQSPQLYKQMMACSMEKTFMVTPVWRAEKHNTVRHINEIRMMDIEAAFEDMHSIMKHEEECVTDIIKKVIERNSEDLKVLGIELKVPKAIYMTHAEAIKILQKNKVKIEDGADFTPEAEKKLGELYPDTLVFVHSWPIGLRPFYIMPENEDPESKISQGFDLIYKGLEITSGGQRIHLPELLIKMIKKKGLRPEQFKDYIDSFRYGAPFHSGWSIGLERITQLLCGLDNIREATMFPRDRDRLTP